MSENWVQAVSPTKHSDAHCDILKRNIPIVEKVDVQVELSLISELKNVFVVESECGWPVGKQTITFLFPVQFSKTTDAPEQIRISSYLVHGPP